MLRLPTIRQGFAEFADEAADQQMSYRGYLPGRVLLIAEHNNRARWRSECRIRAAQFPREKSLRALDFDADPNIFLISVRTPTASMPPVLGPRQRDLVITRIARIVSSGDFFEPQDDQAVPTALKPTGSRHRPSRSSGVSGQEGPGLLGPSIRCRGSAVGNRGFLAC